MKNGLKRRKYTLNETVVDAEKDPLEYCQHLTDEQAIELEEAFEDIMWEEEEE